MHIQAKIVLLSGTLMACTSVTHAWFWGARGVEVARDGTTRAVIVVASDWEGELNLPEDLPKAAIRRLQSRRQLLQNSVKDLAHYLGKMSGTEIEILTSPVADDRRTPIYIGAPAEDIFGPVGISKEGLFGFRVVADHRQGIGLYGESEVGTSYAIYELLHQLGCRWYMPSDIGEVVPTHPHLVIPEMDVKRAPATSSRTMTQGGRDFLRRNRMGDYGNRIWLSRGDGSLDRFLSNENRETHPEWWGNYWRLTHPGLTRHVAEKIIEQLNTVYEPMQRLGLRPAYQLTPRDGQVPTEDPLDRKHDPDPRVWEPAAGRWSVTDRCIFMISQIAKHVRAKYPEVTFGDYAYVNKSYPPARYSVPDDFQIVIAPIDFNRHHPMTWQNHPNEDWLSNMVKGWGKTGADLGAYWYGINLAEISAPCPFIAKWGTDVAILLENGLRDWQPETMNGWDSMLPGYYLAIRMTFYPEETPKEILGELWTQFYGAAAEPMARYWNRIDTAYLDANEFAGSPFGYLKIFTPEVMKSARADLDEALGLAKTADTYRRVLLIDESFGLFEWYMKMRSDWADGNVTTLEDDYAVWRQGVRAMQRKYGIIDRFARDGYSRGLVHVQGRHGNPAWSDSMYSLGYKDGSRMEREYDRLGKPMVEWKWRHNPDPEADAIPWTTPTFDDTSWPMTHVVRDTWSSLGHHLSMTDASRGTSGRMVYRASQHLDAMPEGKRVFLWIGATDGTAKVYVNGKPISYVVPKETRQNKAGDVLDRFSGYCTSAQFDITAALQKGDNQFTILAERVHLNELGIGGLIGPVVLYQDK